MISPRGRIDLLAETILAAPASRIDIANLDLLTYRHFKIHTVARNPLGWQARYYLYVNGDEVKANYRTQYQRVDGAGTTSARVNDPRIMDILSGRQGFSTLEMILDTVPNARWVGQDFVDQVGAVELFSRGTYHSPVITNVTQITVVSERIGVGEQNGLDTNSYVRIYGARP